MDGRRFDALTKVLIAPSPRRAALRLLAGGILGHLLAPLRKGETLARRRCRRPGHPCARDRRCCTRRCGCTNGQDCVCRARGCQVPRASCARTADCCDGPCGCTNGLDCTCRAADCVTAGSECATATDCCGGPCAPVGGTFICRHATCLAAGATCATTVDCCQGFCGDDHRCSGG